MMKSLILLTLFVASGANAQGVEVYHGSHVCHFTKPAYSDEEIAAVQLYRDCQNKKIVETKPDFSYFQKCAPLPQSANLKAQGRYNRARLCADSEYSDQKNCLRESTADADFKSMIEDCKKLRAAETKMAQETMQKRRDNDSFCMKSFEKGFSLANKEPCRNRTMLPPPPSAPSAPQK